METWKALVESSWNSRGIGEPADLRAAPRLVKRLVEILVKHLVANYFFTRGKNPRYNELVEARGSSL